MSFRMRGVVVLAALALLVGCSPDLPTISQREATACASLIETLPDEVDGEDRSRDSDRTATWGGIELTCGVELPAAYDDFASCSEIGGVGWFLPPAELRDPSQDIVITALTHSPRVSVLVPAAHRGSDVVQVQIAPAIRETLEQGAPCL